MSINIHNIINKIPIPLLLLTTILTYINAGDIFFQQDEWLGFSRIITLQHNGIDGLLDYAFSPKLGHFAPLNIMAIYLAYSLFEFNYFNYFLLSLFFHQIVVILVFYLIKELLNNFKIAFLTALLFATSATHFQATTWVVADLSIHGASIFGLIALILFLKFINTGKKKVLLISILSIYISLMFKEITLFLFVFFPFLLFIYRDRLEINKISNYLVIISAGTIYFTFRGFMAFTKEVTGTVVTQTQNFTDLLYNIMTFPIKGIVQSIIPSSLLVEVTNIINVNYFKIINNPEYYELHKLTIQKISLEIINFTLFFIICLLLLILYKNTKEIYKKPIIFGFAFSFLASIIFALAPESDGVIVVVDSRNLYLICIGTSLLLSSFIFTFNNIIKSIVLIITLIAFNIYWINEELLLLAGQGLVRKNILSKIKTDYPKLPEKVLFYTESDASFYGISSSERIFPFQSGFGQTLLVWYETVTKFPPSFFQDRFLWNIRDQGYKESNGRGFGYFRDFNLLADTVIKKQLSHESVIAYSYDSKTESVSNISEEVRGRISGFKASKNEVPVKGYKIESLENSREVNFMLDGDRSTFWDSQKTYDNIQTIQIDLVEKKRISHIQIDSYQNKNQDKVGYEISISDNQKEWKRVFNSKTYPPSSDGIVDIYIYPEQSRFIRIKQIGEHKYASWIIYELDIFETLQ